MAYVLSNSSSLNDVGVFNSITCGVHTFPPHTRSVMSSLFQSQKYYSWPAIADMNYLNSVIRVIKLLYMESMGNFYQSRTVKYQRLVVKFINLSMIQGQIIHCLYIFCSVKMCPHLFQNRVLFYCIHLMAGILLITFFPSYFTAWTIYWRL